MTVIGRIARHPSRPERLAIIAPDGKPLAWFGQDETLDQIADKLRAAGYAVDDDGTVTQVEH